MIQPVKLVRPAELLCFALSLSESELDLDFFSDEISEGILVFSFCFKKKNYSFVVDETEFLTYVYKNNLHKVIEIFYEAGKLKTFLEHNSSSEMFYNGYNAFHQVRHRLILEKEEPL